MEKIKIIYVLLKITRRFLPEIFSRTSTEVVSSSRFVQRSNIMECAFAWVSERLHHVDDAANSGFITSPQRW